MSELTMRDAVVIAAQVLARRAQGWPLDQLSSEFECTGMSDEELRVAWIAIEEFCTYDPGMPMKVTFCQRLESWQE